MNFDLTVQEHRYTSTGVKFWRHPDQMKSYRAGTGRTVISTHISPEGACNLKCPYCSVTHRDTHQRIQLETVKKYVEQLMTRGLKAVILTGGGEPTLYHEFNELVRWISEQELKVALITNGTLTKRVDADVWRLFSWVRVSLNVFPEWESKINLPVGHLSSDCVVGCSIVYTPEHRLPVLKQVSTVASRLNASYIRVLPNCLLHGDHLLRQHEKLDQDLQEVNDPRFFQQHKLHAAPQCDSCHQSFFRPYLSEQISEESGTPGTVFPCDSVVLNGAAMHFPKLYQLCSAERVLDYMDGKITPKFTPKKDCSGCVFTKNVEMLGQWKENGEGQFTYEKLAHEEFP